MKVALVFPPQGHFTQPYLSLPSLTAYLLVYAGLLTAYISVLFYLASQAAAGYIPRERERLDNPLQQPARA